MLGKCGLYLVLPSGLPLASICPRGPVLFLPSLSHLLSLGHAFPLPTGVPIHTLLGSAGPSSQSTRWHPHLILGQLSCRCKSAPIIHHLVPDLSRRAEGARPGGFWLEEGRETRRSIISESGVVLA